VIKTESDDNEQIKALNEWTHVREIKICKKNERRLQRRNLRTKRIQKFLQIIRGER